MEVSAGSFDSHKRRYDLASDEAARKPTLRIANLGL